MQPEQHLESPRHLRLALAQINATVGDLPGNVERMLRDLRRAATEGVDLIAFPELALTGYPPEDLLLKPGFVADNLRALDHLTAETRAFPGLTVVLGFVDRAGDLYNAAAVLHEGRRLGVYHKRFLPNYGVFDEDRYFSAGIAAPNYTIGGATVGINICEDIWYPTGPATDQATAGAELLLNISASPYFMGKQQGRERMLATRAADSGAIVAYANLVGGQDELVFDGRSVVFDQRGELLARAKGFAEDFLVVDLDIEDVFRTRLHDPRRRKEQHQALSSGAAATIFVSAEPRSAAGHNGLAAPDSAAAHLGPTARIEPLPDRLAEAYQALTLGVGDYVRKNGFRDAVIGLSGGIDSALTAVIAVDALGREHVWGVSMPSQYSSQGSRDDARALADNLGIRYTTLPIAGPFEALMDVLRETFASGPPTDSTVPEENLQARIRGNLLMALSNRFGSLVLTTGNKSEMAVGYATLYGDMAGGFAVLKDVYKTLVYELARWRNRVAGERPETEGRREAGPQWGTPPPSRSEAGRALIPESTLTKPPSAELRPGQQDTDSLPPYDVLDPILDAYVEDDRDFAEIVRLGFAPETVRRVMRLVDASEYKRRQAPPGIKITERAFGRDRRLPLTSAYHGQPSPYGAARASADAPPQEERRGEPAPVSA
jgi:NAD+ synthase (glutamine-hydrolysing)